MYTKLQNSYIHIYIARPFTFWIYNYIQIYNFGGNVMVVRDNYRFSCGVTTIHEYIYKKARKVMPTRTQRDKVCEYGAISIFQ